jgi:hypothetical protein
MLKTNYKDQESALIKDSYSSKQNDGN